MYINNARFEWDIEKARSNAQKHGIGFKEAVMVFLDPQSLVAEDLAHSHYERRQWLIGESIAGRVLVVVFTRRGDSIRVISARQANAKERMRYHAKTQGISV